MSSLHVVGRRAFLRGAGGIVVSLPFLHMFAGRGDAASTRPPRLVIVYYPHGTLFDRFIPSAKGALPATLPEIIAPLAPHKSQLNILSGIDNIVRRTMTASNGHNGAARSIFTCQPFQGVKDGAQPDNGPADGPSFDWAVGARMQGDAPRTVVNLGINLATVGENVVFWQAAGQAAGLDADPAAAADKLFVGVGDNSMPPPEPTPAELLRKRRASVLDVVLDGYKRLSSRAPAEDRERLDAHAEQIRKLEKLTQGAGGLAGAQCAKPDFSGLFPPGYDPSDGFVDDVSARAQIENAAMALACDISRVVTIQFDRSDNPYFPWLFGPGENAAISSGAYSNWHDMVHTAESNGDGVGVDRLAQGFAWYMQQVADLRTRLGQIDDGDQKLADNTLVLATSDLGDGAAHLTENLPLVLLGTLGGRLKANQHLDGTGYTSGDLFTTLQSILVNDDTPFGMTGVYKDTSGEGLPDRPFHKGLVPGLV